MLDQLKFQVLADVDQPLGEPTGSLEDLRALLEDEDAWQVRPQTSAGDDLGLSIDANRFLRSLQREDVDARLARWVETDQVRNALSRTLVMRRALDEDYTPDEQQAIEQALWRLEKEKYFERYDAPIVRRGKSLLQCYAKGEYFAYHLLPLDDEESMILPVVQNGKAIIEQFTGDEGGSSGALAVILFKSGRHAGHCHASGFYRFGIYPSELSMDNEEIADRRFIEVMEGKNVWSSPPPGWV